MTSSRGPPRLLSRHTRVASRGGALTCSIDGTRSYLFWAVAGGLSAAASVPISGPSLARTPENVQHRVGWAARCNRQRRRAMAQKTTPLTFNRTCFFSRWRAPVCATHPAHRLQRPSEASQSSVRVSAASPAPCAHDQHPQSRSRYTPSSTCAVSTRPTSLSGAKSTTRPSSRRAIPPSPNTSPAQ